MEDKNNNCPIPWVSKTFCEGDNLSICDVCKKAYYRGLMVGREGGYEAGFADGAKQGKEKKWEEVLNNFILLKVDDLTTFVQEWREDAIDEFEMNLKDCAFDALNTKVILTRAVSEIAEELRQANAQLNLVKEDLVPPGAWTKTEIKDDEFKINLNMIQTKILNNWENLKKTIGEENE